MGSLSRGSPAQATAARSSSAAAIPPHRVKVLHGVHAYTDKLSVAAGDTIQFHTSSTVPFRLSVCRLGRRVDDPTGDQVLHEFPAALSKLQPIHPGSYVHVEKSLDPGMPLQALTVECWLRPYLSDQLVGIITQFDRPNACGLGLFMAPNYGLAFYLGDGESYDVWRLHKTRDNVLHRRKWHHVVATWDGKEKTIWVDGEQMARWPFAITVRPGSSPLRLGARGEYGEAFRFIDADLAMPVIYQRSLRDAEIAKRHGQKGLTSAQGKDVLACWPLAEERGDRVADASGHGHDGRIINQGTWMIGGPSFDAGSVSRWGHYDPQLDPRRGHGLRLSSDDLYDCRWEATHEFRIPPHARSGFYVGRYQYLLSGTQRTYHAPFFVRRPKTSKTRPPVLLLAATNTYRAYTYRPFAEVPAALHFNDDDLPNGPGDPPAYSFYGRHRAGHVAYQLGLRMPSPNSGPYVLSMGGNEKGKYSHLTRADRLTEAWLAKTGYDYDVITDLDLHQDPDILRGYRVFMINGHSEYWSVPAYQTDLAP